MEKFLNYAIPKKASNFMLGDMGYCLCIYM